MGLIHLDAGVVIGLLDADDAHHDAATAAIARARLAGQRFGMAASAFAECLVGPVRRGDREVEIVEGLFQRLPIDVAELSPGTARLAARLRAQHRAVRLPDALVIATAATLPANALITTDRRWPSSEELGLDLTITVL